MRRDPWEEKIGPKIPLPCAYNNDNLFDIDINFNKLFIYTNNTSITMFWVAQGQGMFFLTGCS